MTSTDSLGEERIKFAWGSKGDLSVWGWDKGCDRNPIHQNFRFCYPFTWQDGTLKLSETMLLVLSQCIINKSDLYYFKTKCLIASESSLPLAYVVAGIAQDSCCSEAWLADWPQWTLHSQWACVFFTYMPHICMHVCPYMHASVQEASLSCLCRQSNVFSKMSMS